MISDGNHQCSFIVDFNGIDNFIASKSLIFNDYDVRELVIKHLNLVEGKFKRFGASGSRPSEKHPGGEVVELQTIDVKNKTGCAGSVSGYLDMSNNEYSKAISLSEDGLTLREERTVYSHTIWIPENSKPIIVRVQSNIKGLRFTIWQLIMTETVYWTPLAKIIARKSLIIQTNILLK